MLWINMCAFEWTRAGFESTQWPRIHGDGKDEKVLVDITLIPSHR